MVFEMKKSLKRYQMKNPSVWLLDYKKNVYSQTGEDGILGKILEILPDKNNWCVEFGAFDGIKNSNTRHLIESKEYSAVLIEPNKDRFKSLQKNNAGNEKVITMRKLVGFSEDNNLDHILGDTDIPIEFDLLSIDIDGNDYYVWKAISKYTPKVVIIEFNATIPTEISFTQVADEKVHQGSSLKSIAELGKQKGYELVSVLAGNAIFVKKDYFPLFNIPCNAPETLRVNLNSLTYLFVGFDGKIFLKGCCKIPWHRLDIKESKVQVLPAYLRKFPGNYSPLQKMLLSLFRMITNKKKKV